MKLTLDTSYLSIKTFEPTELPAFTLITGMNGTGKTHLLRAIMEGRIVTDVASNPNKEIRLYDWNSLVPQETGIYDGHAWQQQRAQLLAQFQTHHREIANQIVDAARREGIPQKFLLQGIPTLLQLTPVELGQISHRPADGETIYTSIKSTSDRVAQDIKNRLSQHGNHYHQMLEQIANHTNKPIASLTSNDFFKTDLGDWGKVSLFQQSFSKLFVTYRDLALSNNLKTYQKSLGKEVDALTNDEFIAKHMIAPWSFVNEAMDAAGLDFEIDHPDLFSFTPYSPTLTKRSTRDTVLFSDLSSGEKILMSFAICLYYTGDTRQLTEYPKILLLDEIDAPLHPSMSRTLINLITNTIVAKHKIHVIATTHSPSTIAIAPEEAIHIIERGKAEPRKVSKAAALNILTDGVPTLSISFDGRRQVFVESSNDASIYDSLYQALKPRLPAGRSLEFIAASRSHSESGTHMDGGCGKVRQLVDTLRESGNISVFGLIDWDGKNQPSTRVRILADGRRNGLENVVFDPVLLASLIAKDVNAERDAIGLSKFVSYPEFLAYTVEDLQNVVNAVQEKVLGTKAEADVSCLYCGGFQLRLRSEYLRKDDHQIAEQVLSAFPALNAFAKKKPFLLMRHIADSIIRDKPEFAPIELIEAFEVLLNTESH